MVQLSDPFPFTPVAPRPRRDGWTPEIQKRFIAALAVGGSVLDACRHVGRSRDSAYKLRARADAVEFAGTWDAAIGGTEDALVDGAVERCVEGVKVPVVYRGRVVGERTKLDNRLLMFMLRRRELSASRLRRERDDISGKSQPGIQQDPTSV